jgi:dTDP-glucose 4,6-dehydratase
MSPSAKPVSVVTGGAGFLGSHLTDRLLTEGHRVIAIDNLITGNVANIGHLAGNENYHFIRHNVSNFIFYPSKRSISSSISLLRPAQLIISSCQSPL